MTPRRVLNIPRILWTGVVLGLIGGGVYAVVSPHVPGYSIASEVGLLAVVGAMVGLLVAGVVVALVDRDR
ncbi:MAG TPA: hypothetical protein PLQ23_03390 [Dermatophilaceae bacterium]|nr:hypothetical protein [Dermatophilaceae bacterium]